MLLLTPMCSITAVVHTDIPLNFREEEVDSRESTISDFFAQTCITCLVYEAKHLPMLAAKSFPPKYKEFVAILCTLVPSLNMLLFTFAWNT